MNHAKRLVCFLIAALAVFSHHGLAFGQLQAGAAIGSLTPVKLPVIVNGGFLQKTIGTVSDPLRVRCLILSDGKEKIGLVVADSCMIPRSVCDRIKKTAVKETGIPMNRLLISATHTHSAPSLMDMCLGTEKDAAYVEFFVQQVAKCIVLAHSRLQPAEVGHGSTDAPEHTFCRRWIRAPGQLGNDPFRKRTIGAMMHPGYQNAAYVGPSGPVDSELSLLSVRSTTGEPICVFANYSMHYVGGAPGLSADYFGYFANEMSKRIVNSNETSGDSEFVAMMSQGTAGDLHWMDYSQPRKSTTLAKYADELAEIAFEAYKKIEYRTDVGLGMAESRITLGRRIPDESRLAWAHTLNEARGDRRPKNRPEVYAQQAPWIAENPNEQVVLQAIRIGDLSITGIPNEVFAVTGLSLKAQSPLDATFNIELANGAAGYIPPPEQHKLGGYTTWPARTAGLEVEAEPKIIEELLSLIEKISGKKRRPLTGDLYPESIRSNMKLILNEQ